MTSVERVRPIPLRIHPESRRVGSAAERVPALEEFQGLVRRQLELLGESPDRPGLAETPERVARSLSWLTSGYRQDVNVVVGDAVFAEAHEGMVMVRDIE